MATKKTAVPELKETENEDLELAAAEEKPQDRKDELAAKDAEIAKLKAQLAAAKKPEAGKRESDYERVHRIEKETIEAGLDPWSVMVEVLVPHREKTEDPWYWLNVNGLSVQVPANDRYEKLKLPWACLLVDHLRYEKASVDFQDSLEVYDPETNPHRA